MGYDEITPPVRDAARYPVSGGIALLAIIASIAYWAGRDVSVLFDQPGWWPGQPWRVVTSALPHADPIHLLFNLYWLWRFGTLLERRWGHLPVLGLMAFLAAGSGMAEFAALDGGIGLSGIVYGLFGLLWVLARRAPSFRGAIDRNTVLLFVGWFVFCIFMTATDILPVGNVAHGAGAALGALIGWTLTSRPAIRFAGFAGLAVILCGLTWCASAGRQYVNFASPDSADIAQEALAALKAERYDQTIGLYRRAIALDSRRANYWYNLGVALDRLSRKSEAVTAFRRAIELDGKYRNDLQGTQVLKIIDGPTSRP